MQPSAWRGIARYARKVTASLELERVQAAHLGAVRDMVLADAYGIYLVDPDSLRLIAGRGTGVSDDFLRCYEELGRERDPFFQRMLRTHQPIHDGMIKSRASARAYWDNLLSNRLTFTMQAPLVYGRRMFGTTNFARSRGRGPFRQEDLERVMVLGHYASAAAAHALAYRVMRDRSVAAESVIRTSRTPVVISNDGGTVTVASATVDPLDAEFGEILAESVRALTAADGDSPTEITRHWGESQVRSRRVPGASSMIVTHVLEGDDRPPRFTALAGFLTPREVDVVELVGLGLSDAEIATRLFVSTHTVKQHLKSVYRKLGARSRADALRRVWALESRSGAGHGRRSHVGQLPAQDQQRAHPPSD